MKKILCTIAAALLLAGSAMADEGMWLLPLLEKLNAGTMKSLGCRLTADQIYSANHSSIKDAIVIFGNGCTGEMISSKGLLVTNHHCGYSSIQRLSSDEHNYLEDGFWAMNTSEEIPVPGLSVRFLVSITDVTAAVESAADPDAVKKTLSEEAVANNKGCTANVYSFYNDNLYYLIVYKTYTDIRFVGAPPASVGKFGGETDNWMWPRHTGDFSMFRVYAGRDNEPAEYSESNKPYTPAHSLPISLKGINEGDFTFIMGYPGGTQRFQTEAQLEQMLALQDISIGARTLRQDIMWKWMEKSPSIRLKYANKYASSANGWKKWQGEKLAFDNLGIIAKEHDKEAAFQKWVGKNKVRTQKYGSALQDIAEGVAASAEVEKDIQLLGETLFNIEIIGFGANLSNLWTRELRAGKDSVTALNNALNALERAYKDYYEPLDREEAAALLKYYRSKAKPENYLQGFSDDFATMDIDKYVADLYSNTVFTSYDKVKEAIGEGGMEAIRQDPASTLMASIFMAYSKLDALTYRYYSTIYGVMEKEDPDNYEFRVPEKLKQLYLKRDYGQYAMADGNLPCCFLTNNDITGGNSGSPVMNADGHLIGLAFDGNWESMSSDVMFEPDLQRCICVDIRYVLFMMDKFGGAGYLLKEMNIVK